MPVIFIAAAQDISGGGIGRYGSIEIELGSIPHHPHQLAVVVATNPVTGNGGVLTGGFTQQLTQRIQPSLGNRRLPGAVASAFGKLVEDAARFF